MLEYARWKYVVFVVLLVLSLFYAAPNAFPQDPSVQVTANRGATIDAGVQLVLLDNFSTADTRTAVDLVRCTGVRLEASGGLDLSRAAAVAATGVDYLAVGAITHSAPVLDLGFDLR